MRTAVNGFQWQRKTCSTSTLFRRAGVDDQFSVVAGSTRKGKRGDYGMDDCHRVLISNGLDCFVLLARRADVHLVLIFLFSLRAARSEAFLFLRYPSLLHSKCWLSFSCFSFILFQSLLSQPFVSPAFDSAGHSMSPSRATSRRPSPLLSQSCPSGRQLCHSQFPFRTRDGIQRRAQELPSPFCPTQRGRSL